jgi:hypothetical protein
MSLDLRSPDWIRGAVRNSAGLDRVAARRVIWHLDIWLPHNVIRRLDEGLYPGIDEPVPPHTLRAYAEDAADAYAWWADRTRIAQGELWPEIALRYRLPRAFGKGRQESMVRLAREAIATCPTCLRPW